MICAFESRYPTSRGGAAVKAFPKLGAEKILRLKPQSFVVKAQRYESCLVDVQTVICALKLRYPVSQGEAVVHAFPEGKKKLRLRPQSPVIKPQRYESCVVDEQTVICALKLRLCVNENKR